MLVYDFMPLSSPFATAAQWVHGLPSGCLAAAASVAFGLAERDGRLEHGTARNRDDALLIDLYWAGSPTRAWFDHLEGELQLAPLTDGRSHLSLSASYAPSGGAPSSWGERARAHREAEAHVREFLIVVARSVVAGEHPS